MRNHAVVLTYPGHFLLTRLTLCSIKEFFPEITKITVIVDDFARLVNMTRQQYVQNCIDVYQTVVIPLSRYDFLQPFDNESAETGWLRQQIVKLHLDLILDIEQCFFSDGDIGFTSNIMFGATPHGFISAKLNNSTRSNSQDAYIFDLLGVPAIEHWTKNKLDRKCTSVCAFRDLDMHTIKSLRQFVENRLNVNFIEHHIKLFQQINRYTISEWELLETYREKILNEKINWLFCPPRSYTDYFEPVNASHPRPYFYTCYGTDADFTEDWQNRISTKFGQQTLPFVLTR